MVPVCLFWIQTSKFEKSFSFLEMCCPEELYLICLSLGINSEVVQVFYQGEAATALLFTLLLQCCPGFQLYATILLKMDSSTVVQPIPFYMIILSFQLPYTDTSCFLFIFNLFSLIN